MSKQKGDEAEEKALSFLEGKNFQIVEKNFYAKKLGEIDIIALKDETYHFCEVKSAQDFETAILNISKQKLSKIKKSIAYYMQSKKINSAFCIDAIIVVNNEIELIENISI